VLRAISHVQIASMSQPITMLAKEAVQKAFETSLEEGVFLERRLFMSTFATVSAGLDLFLFLFLFCLVRQF
jgi:hypothetical protein